VACIGRPHDNATPFRQARSRARAVLRLGSRITAQIIPSLIETRPPLPDLVFTNCRRP